MPPQPETRHAPGLGLSDVYYAIFRHKWKLVICTVAGLVAALVYLRTHVPPLKAEAKLFIRYIETERKTTLGPSSGLDTMARSPDVRGETIMNSEIEILTSMDLVREVSEAIGPARLLAHTGGTVDPGRAVGLIKSGLVVDVLPRSTVIRIAFTFPDGALIQPVLRELIDRYLRKHHEIHRSAGLVRDSLAQETDQLRSRLALTEEDLRQKKNQAGVISIAEARRVLTEQMAATRQQLLGAQATLAEHQSVLDEYSKRTPGPVAPSPEMPGRSPVPPEKISEHANLASQLEHLLGIERELSTQFTPESDRVKTVRAQIADVREQRRRLHAEFPGLALAGEDPAARSARSTTTLDVNSIASQATALRAKIKVLATQLDELRGEAAKIDQTEAAISELQRRKDLEEANYRYYSATLEQSRINETLGNGRTYNINEIQSPSPPARDWTKTYKNTAMIGAGGLVLGVGWLFLIELYLDRSLRRPVDIQRFLKAPLLISIPVAPKTRPLSAWLKLPTALRTKPAANATESPMAALPHEGINGANAKLGEVAALDPFYETLRDRIMVSFEARNLTHKPKLVALTSLKRKAGVTTVATALARSLSETKEGNVLLVDMTVEDGAAHHLVNGTTVRGLTEALENRPDGARPENLFVVAANDGSDRLSRNLPRRFMKLVPKLKASDFDYIIFDMPPVNQVSITPRLAVFMDMLLIVVQAGTTDRENVQRVTEDLAASKAQVGVILNQTRHYIPSFLHQECA